MFQVQGMFHSSPFDGMVNVTQFFGESSRGHLGVSKIGGKNPKWMVKIMENPIKMDDLGVALFLETPTWTIFCFECSNVFVSSSF